MSEVASPKRPDWFILICAAVTIALLGAHSLSILENLVYDLSLFWPFAPILGILWIVIFLMCRVIAYEFCGKAGDD